MINSESGPETRPALLKLGLEPSVSQWRVSIVASEAGLIFYDKLEPTPERPMEVIWTSAEGSTRFHLIGDPFLAQTYLVASGPGAEGLVNLARERLGALTLDDVISRSRHEESEEDRITTAALLGALAPAHHVPEVVEAIRVLLSSPVARIREKAVTACAYPSWPEFRPLLERVRADDPEPSVRDRAAAALQAFDDFGVASA